MKAYKVFNSDWRCRSFRYEVGEIYEMKEDPIPCERGFHACIELAYCFNYYDFDYKNKVAEVEMLGKIRKCEDTKIVTNKIKIVKEIPWVNVVARIESMEEKDKIKFVESRMCAIGLFDDPSEPIQLAAVESHWLAIEFIKNPTLKAKKRQDKLYEFYD